MSIDTTSTRRCHGYTLAAIPENPLKHVVFLSWNHCTPTARSQFVVGTLEQLLRALLNNTTHVKLNTDNVHLVQVDFGKN